MSRPDLSLLPISVAFQALSRWLEPKMPPKLLHAHEKISDGGLVALAVLQKLHKVPHFNRWWAMIRQNVFLWLPSEPQARTRLKRLLPIIEGISVEVQCLDFVVIDSAPLPTCTYKRAPRCKFPGAAYGFSTAGPVYGFKLHAWTTLNGHIAKYEIHPANEHDYSVGCMMNRDWPAYGGPKQLGDKGYQSDTYITPSKANAKKKNPRWKEEYAAARKIIESTFSALMGAGLRWGQIKTFVGLRLKVALGVLAHNLKYIDLGELS